MKMINVLLVPSARTYAQARPRQGPRAATRLHRALDLLGALLSIGCAAHCMALPLILAFLPSAMLALRSFQHPAHGFMTLLLTLSRWEWVFAVTASTFAMLSVSLAARRHHDRSVLTLAALGALLLVASSSVPALREALFWHGMLAALGGSLLAAAHLRNRGLQHRIKAPDGSTAKPARTA